MNKRSKVDFTALRTTFSATPRTRDDVVARVLLVIEYDETPDRASLDEVVEKAREIGGVECAIYEHLAPTHENLV